jgi:hypothetical protein
MLGWDDSDNVGDAMMGGGFGRMSKVVEWSFVAREPHAESKRTTYLNFSFFA